MSTIPAEFARALHDRYRIERELGRGGMATVFLADDLKHRRKVALKVMHPEMAAAIGHERFLREIEIAARLAHPHILPLYDSGAADGQLFYVMPYIAGESLRARLDRERQLPLDEALRLAREIASALGHAHRLGLVHRDIKPENVLLADGIALVADFGIARVNPGAGGNATQAETRVTAEGLTLGTPLYMAPEQAMGGEIDGRADLYSLGCVLYEMLGGQPPFMAPTLAGIIERHRRDPVPPVSSLRPGLPDAIGRVIEKALAKTPADRHAGMARFAESLTMAETGARTPTPAPDAATHEAEIPNNLPRQRTSFIGRERELAECARLMGETRLLTLTGVGGCGKTRLALKLAEGLIESHPDGVWWVDLAAVSDDTRLILALAGAVGVQEEPGRTLTETLVDHFGARHTLLILDNCEHLLNAASELADALLASDGNLRILVTSREGLGLEGEHVFALRSLAAPSARAADDFAAIEASDAVRLFVDRARQATRDFALTPQAAPAVAEICRRLDGMPLAIELAAARVKLLTVEQIQARLDDRFKLLTGGTRALPRHQTLRATIQWSYDQLEPEEQRLFRAMAVFSGGWILAAAVAVAGENKDEFEVLDDLGRLVDKSLVNVDRESGGEARYTMLETVRQFALEVLNESPERDAVRSRHLDYYAQKSTGWARKFTTDFHATDHHTEIDAELENWLAAHAWAGQAQDGARSLALMVGMRRYWSDRGLYDLGARVASEALERPGADAPAGLRAQLLAQYGDLHYYTGNYEDARQAGRESLAIARKVGDPMVLMLAIDSLASSELACGDIPAARELCIEYVALARAEGNRPMLVTSLTYLGEIHRADGNLEAASGLYGELLPLARGRPNAALAIALFNYAMIRSALGHVNDAIQAMIEANPIVFSARSRRIRNAFVDAMAGVACAGGAPELGLRLYGASNAGLERMNARREPADQGFIDTFVRPAKEAIGGPRAAALITEGQTWTADQALEAGVEWLKGAAGARTA